MLVAVSIAVAGTPPPGFVETQVVTGGPTAGAIRPVAVAYEPGTGDLWVVEKGDGTAEGTNRVRVRDAETGTVSTALDLPCVDSRGERGLLGIAFSPDYLVPGGAGRHVYLYYTRRIAADGACAITGETEASRNRVSRFIENGGTLSAEEVVLEGPDLTAATNHNAGTLRFAPDGTLFISMGDNNTAGDSPPASRDLGDLRGKLLRIHGDGSVPDDNPFVGQAGARPEVYAWGLRNPFRFSIDPETGAPVIADVGQNTWEAIYVGVPGADYGYPCFEGMAPLRTCDPEPPVGSVTMPIFVYGHGDQTLPVSGNSIIGGPVYRADAFPEEYHGHYFFGDWGQSWIRRGRITPDGRLVDVEMFIPDADRVVDMVVSPAGCLTWVSLSGGGVSEVCPAEGSNRQPRAVAVAEPASGTAPLQVQLTGSGSTDPDGDALQYAWDVGEGPILEEADPVHTYPTEGVFDVVLTVDDQQLADNSVDASPPVRVVVGNNAPTVSIGSPAAGGTYDAGAAISFAGSADDPEDGTLPADGFSWTVSFHHEGRGRPFLGPLTGISSGQFTVPTTGEDATDVFYRVRLRVTDSGAPVGDAGRLASSTFVDVFPNVSTITLRAEPAGLRLELALDGMASTAPIQQDSVVGFPRTLTAPSPQILGGKTYEFVSWSDGGAREHSVSTPPSDTTYLALFACVSNCGGSDDDGDGFTAAEGDCDDTDRNVYPGAPEICDVKDNDCDGGTDDAVCDDFDTTGDGSVDGLELAWLGRAFGQCSADPELEWWYGIDLRPDGCVDGDDLVILANIWACEAGQPVCPSE